MEINSRYCEVSTYAASSGYNSSTASSSLNYIDVDNLSVIDNQCINSSNEKDESGESSEKFSRLIITITLVKKEQVLNSEKINSEFFAKSDEPKQKQQKSCCYYRKMLLITRNKLFFFVLEISYQLTTWEFPNALHKSINCFKQFVISNWF